MFKSIQVKKHLNLSKWIEILGTILREVSLDLEPPLGSVRELLQRLG